ncbi:MAG: acyl-CoA dehydrogenase [Syntrophomonadaceae bacterium]|jgi:alkylation response protein AidB-like acyl-CoA dehydrogenase|nr:acyl-CoA dehydrogenase [Syntrophomonadaceae bacterium]
MDFTLTEEQHQMVEMVEDFARREVAPLTLEMDQNQTFLPAEVWRKMAGLNLLASFVPEEYGGLNHNCIDILITRQAYARGGGCLGSLLSWGASDGIGTVGILKHGTEQQKQKYLPGIVSGDIISCFALTEPDSGSDAFKMRSRAVKQGDHYVLNGTKMLITNGPFCDMGIVLAITDPTKGVLGISAFIFEKDFPGFSRGKKIDKMGMRSSPTSELIFEDCIIPEENLLGGEGMGALVANTTLHWERIGMGFAIGAMEYNLKLCQEYAAQRIQFGEPIGNFQSVRHRLAEMKIDIEAAKYLFYRMAWLVDTDQIPAILDISVGKAFLSKALVKNADAAISTFGGYGVCCEYPVQRSYRDAKIIEIGGGTYDIQLNMIAAALMGPRQKVKK